MRTFNTGTKRNTGGFTLVALAVVLVIGMLLAGVLTRAMAEVRLKTLQIRCSANLQQLAKAAQIYAEADPFNLFPACNGAFWPWDIPAEAVHGLMENGATRENFYCPGFPEQNNDQLWKFTAGDSINSGFRVTGYAMAFRRAGRVRATNTTESLNPAPYRVGNTEYQVPSSERVLIADATLSMGANETDRSKNNYTRIFGGWNKPHRAAHLNGQMPAGGNLVFLDGHAEWRPFEKMRVRTDGNPPFWW